VLWFTLRTQAPAVSGSAAAPPASAAPAAAQLPADIEIRVSATPAEARIFFDEEPLAQNPGARRWPRDGRSHKLRVEAPGYITTYRNLATDRDLMIEVALERVPAGAYASPPIHPPPKAPADVVKRRDARPTRPLDTSNPFTNP
jgi:eukaryotic-like serine/threonine-protein kinase